MALGIGLTTLAPESIAETIQQTKVSIKASLDNNRELPTLKKQSSKLKKPVQENIEESGLELKMTTSLNLE
jgi:hypothetical protein